MKKLPLILLILIHAKFTQAQFYVGASGSYGVKAGGQMLARPGNISVIPGLTADSVNQNTAPVSFGGGLLLGGLVGYRINDKIAIELTANRHYTNAQRSLWTLRSDFELSGKMNGRFNMISPSVIYTFSKKSVDYYARLGLVYAQGEFLFKNEWLIDSNKANYDVKYLGANGLGWQLGFGLTKNISERLDFFVELHTNQLSVYPKSAELINYTFNGVDGLSNISVSEKETLFVKEAPIFATNMNVPTKVLRQKIPLHRIGCKLGVRFFLSKKNK